MKILDQTVVAIVLSVLFVSINASAQMANASRGKSIAESWCSGCHVVGSPATEKSADRAPPLQVIAANPAKTPDYLRGWLAKPHAPMPDLTLGRREIEDLVAYIRSLKPVR